MHNYRIYTIDAHCFNPAHMSANSFSPWRIVSLVELKLAAADLTCFFHGCKRIYWNILWLTNSSIAHWQMSLNYRDSNFAQNFCFAWHFQLVGMISARVVFNLCAICRIKSNKLWMRARAMREEQSLGDGGENIRRVWCWERIHHSYTHIKSIGNHKST